LPKATPGSFLPVSAKINMASRLVHPRMMERLERDFFAQSCTIEEATTTRNVLGEVSLSGWETKYTAVPCHLAAAGGGERRTNQQVYLEATHTIALAGQYTDLNEQMRAVVDEQAYEILLAETDSEGAMTRLTCRIIR